MRKLAQSTVLLISLVFAGCTTYSNKHFALMDAPAKESIKVITNNIKSTIEPILNNHGLEDRMTKTMPEGVMLYYSSGGNSAIRIGFRVHEKRVVFDAFQYHPGAGDTDEYTGVVNEVLSALREIEGVNLVQIDGPSM
ncbi:hypothetical protein [Bacterioplanoides sp.]|uniref:hypothetical protein n=1 Tax=Bacterioplanoides sp. TaxID=2066072 RepID=UPI003B58E96D